MVKIKRNILSCEVLIKKWNITPSTAQNAIPPNASRINNIAVLDTVGAVLLNAISGIE